MKTENVLMIEMSYEDMKSVEGGFPIVPVVRAIVKVATALGVVAELHDAAQEIRDGWNAAEGADEFSWEF